MSSTSKLPLAHYLNNNDGSDDRPANIPHCCTEREFVSLEQTSQTTCPCFSPETIRVRLLIESLARGPGYSHLLTRSVFDRMVNDPADQDLIRWSDTGDSFFGGHFLLNYAPNSCLTPYLPFLYSPLQFSTKNDSRVKFSGVGSSTRTLAPLSANSTCTAFARSLISNRVSSVPTRTPNSGTLNIHTFCVVNQTCCVSYSGKSRRQQRARTPMQPLLQGRMWRVMWLWVHCQRISCWTSTRL